MVGYAKTRPIYIFEGYKDAIFEFPRKSKLSAVHNLELIDGDFLKYQLPNERSYIVFANIPYFITTRIIEKLTEAKKPPVDIWIVVEKGAAKRFLGIPYETRNSLFLKTNWEMKIIYHFQRVDFHPKPSVDSVLLHLSLKKIQIWIEQIIIPLKNL
ncbi:rRNA adenine N-6-methyltransferase family protein [Paenibacillus senegalensis]|uniref:rRNA adenine N-6-methyltransferase family protein n=1 Tax=Paenibacillus senegalensis TaxID=1465766 RepID=UPI0002882D58|nr:rRNA adenine N-6-methyltransferase family protein [Paenibacillus senegalensis]